MAYINNGNIDYSPIEVSMMNMKGLVVICLLINLCIAQNAPVKIYPDYKDHPCKRMCDGRQRECVYNLTLDYYFTMQPDCQNCLSGRNYSACLNPQCIPGDGRQKMISVFNSMLPGPSIEVCLNDRVVVYVTNLIDPETTSVHWHGIHQRGNQWNDGVPGITQCPQQPLTTWKYSMTATEAGTHWYHTHSASQRADGAYGHLIIRRPSSNNPHASLYDKDEHIMSLLQWFPTYMSPFYQFRYYRTLDFYAENTATILVNGIGRMANSTLPLARFEVQKGLRYRFRVINAANINCPIYVTIDNHELLVINSDGNDIQPIPVDSLQLANGERFDFILNANQTVDQYAIRIVGGVYCSNSPSLAVLHYQDAPERNLNLDPSFRPTGTRLNCINEQPSSSCLTYNNMVAEDSMDPILTGTPNFKYYFGFDIYQNAPPRFRGILQNEMMGPYINEIAYTQPKTPLILDSQESNWCYYEKKPLNTPACNGSLCDCLHVISIPKGALVELILVDFGKDFDLHHAFHLHGYSFRVIGIQKLGSRVDIETIGAMDKNNTLIRNFNNPPLKDSVGVPDGGYTIIRFIADNPGYWFMYCEGSFQIGEGMGFVLAVGGDIAHVPSTFPRCGDFLG